MMHAYSIHLLFPPALFMSLSVYWELRVAELELVPCTWYPPGRGRRQRGMQAF